MKVQEIIDQVKESLEKSIGPNAVYGDPIEKEGLTLITVSTTSVSGGGGGGTGSKEREEGDVEHEKEGSGFGVGLKINTRPIGYIWIKNEDVGYEPINDTTKLTSIGLIAGAFVLWKLTKILRK